MVKVKYDKILGILREQDVTELESKLLDAINRSSNTGALSGFELTAVEGESLFSVGSGKGVITVYDDPENPVIKEVIFDGQIDITDTGLSNSDFTYVFIDEGTQNTDGTWTGEVVQKLTPPSPLDLTHSIFIGKTNHFSSTGPSATYSTGATVLRSAGYANSVANNVDKLLKGSIITSGNNVVMSTTGFTKEEGFSERLGRDFNSPTPDHGSDPERIFGEVGEISLYGKTSLSGFYDLIPSTQLDGGLYDVGDGTLSTVLNNEATNQTLWFFPVSNALIVTYGRTVYNSLDDAISGASREVKSLAIPSELDGAILLGVLSVRGGASDFSNESDAVFEAFTQIYGNVIGGSGGSGGGLTSVNDSDVTITAIISEIVGSTQKDLNESIDEQIGLRIKSDPSDVSGAGAISNVITLTKDQYDTIVTKDPNTLYKVIDEEDQFEDINVQSTSTFTNISGDNQKDINESIDTLLSSAGLTWGDSITGSSGNGITLTPTSGARGIQITHTGGIAGTSECIRLGYSSLNTNAVGMSALYIDTGTNSGTGTNPNGIKIFARSSDPDISNGYEFGIYNRLVSSGGSASAVYSSTSVPSSTYGLDRTGFGNSIASAGIAKMIDLGTSAQGHTGLKVKAYGASTAQKAVEIDLGTTGTGTTINFKGTNASSDVAPTGATKYINVQIEGVNYRITAQAV